jgi:hypothetical protein
MGDAEAWTKRDKNSGGFMAVKKSYPRARQGDHRRSVGDRWGSTASLSASPSSLLAA